MLRLSLGAGFSRVGFDAYIASLPIALLAAGWTDAAIGALMGVAALTQLPAAFVGGGLMDRFGGRLLFLAGAGCFAIASLLLASGIASAEGPPALLVVVRIFQGMGIAVLMPAALSLVPDMVANARLPTAFAIVGLAANVSLAVAPAISIFVLDATSLPVVAGLALVCLAIGATMAWPIGRADQHRRRARRDDMAAASIRGRTFRPAWRASWWPPLAISFLFVVHWGVVTGYLPQRAEAAGADIALFFTADAAALVAARIPAARLVERLGSRRSMLIGISVTAIALLFLLPPATTPLLVVAGIGTGVGAAFLLPPINFELSRRSTDDVRGSAFALFSFAFSAGVAVGSIGMSLFIASIGFGVAIGIGLSLCLVGGLVVVVDPWLRGKAV
ncbi:MAG TPA: MFS transporter [Candidatus Limnocylindrales bacterium]|jgi:MFS family permease